MGYGSKLNVSIKNDRIVILEKRADAVERLLFSDMKLSHRKMDENTAAMKDLLGSLGNIQSELEFIYAEIMARTVRGRWKRLKKMLASSILKKKNIPGGLVPGKGEKA
jgi:hypothetical protein